MAVVQRCTGPERTVFRRGRRGAGGARRSWPAVGWKRRERPAV